MSSLVRTRWAAIGAAVAVSLGAGGLGLVIAGPLSSGERTVLVPVNCRLADTRPAPDTVGPRTSPLGAGDTYTVAAHGTNGNCTIPADATALALNVTALGATAPLTFLTLWAADQPQPITSALNPAAGQPPTPNAVSVDLSPTGQFKIFNALGSVNVIIDVTGYYQDHHHDDRYYTKPEVYSRSQVDELLRNAPLGRVMARGTVFGNNPPNFSTDTFALDGVTLSISEFAIGRYKLDMNGGGVTDFPTIQVMPFDFGGGRRTCSLATTSLNGSGDYSASVNCYDSTGTLIRTSFGFLIVGAPG